MGEFSPPPLFLSPLRSFFFHRKSIMLTHRPQTPQPDFGSITFFFKNSPPPPPPFQNPGSAPATMCA